MRKDVLILVSTSSEFKAVKNTAKRLSIHFKKVAHEDGRLYDLGLIGDNNVILVKSDMGAFGYNGSASLVMKYVIQFQVTSVIAVGMAFGVSPDKQKIGQILVSNGVITYDYKLVSVDDDGCPKHDYSQVPRYDAKESLVNGFRKMAFKLEWKNKVHFGILLSGGARIQCSAFRDELKNKCQLSEKEIIGGDMEAMGIVSSCAKCDPNWIIVKGISDFANEERDLVIKDGRSLACKSAADLVFDVLKEK